MTRSDSRRFSTLTSVTLTRAFSPPLDVSAALPSVEPPCAATRRDGMQHMLRVARGPAVWEQRLQVRLARATLRRMTFALFCRVEFSALETGLQPL